MLNLRMLKTKKKYKKFRKNQLQGLFHLTSFSMTFSILDQLLRLIILQMTILFQILLKQQRIQLVSEREIAINWFKDNYMILNSGTFQIIISDQHKGNRTNEKKKVLVNAFVMTKINFCSLGRNFSGAHLLNKIEILQKRALCFLLNDYGSTYEDLPEKSGCPNLNLKRQRTQELRKLRIN